MNLEKKLRRTDIVFSLIVGNKLIKFFKSSTHIIRFNVLLHYNVWNYDFEFKLKFAFEAF